MTQTVPDISPLMPMHQDPLLVSIFERSNFQYPALLLDTKHSGWNSLCCNIQKYTNKKNMNEIVHIICFSYTTTFYYNFNKLNVKVWSRMNTKLNYYYLIFIFVICSAEILRTFMFHDELFQLIFGIEIVVITFLYFASPKDNAVPTGSFSSNWFVIRNGIYLFSGRVLLAKSQGIIRTRYLGGPINANVVSSLHI